ncbi:MAG: sigma-70 family RNA polymerase sigma factor [Azoarcus sp.]|jgi:RNA polymerase sigma-70 factor (ECF subfamily)|nr:sigma-70 family RNA polymerase sigma factor [Azoarcus sp.]
MRSLLAQIGKGNHAAFNTLYRRLSQRIFAFVRCSIDDKVLAEEVMMDTLFAVWKNPTHFRGDSRVSTWVLGIARNKMLMALRGNKVREYEDIEDFADLLDSGYPDGLAQIEARQRETLLKDCMRRLPWTHRECMHLLYFEDYSVDEIAYLLEIPAGTVKSRLSRARARLQSCVELGFAHLHPESA